MARRMYGHQKAGGHTFVATCASRMLLARGAGSLAPLRRSTSVSRVAPSREAQVIRMQNMLEPLRLDTLRFSLMAVLLLIVVVAARMSQAAKAPTHAAMPQWTAMRAAATASRAPLPGMVQACTVEGAGRTIEKRAGLGVRLAIRLELVCFPHSHPSRLSMGGQARVWGVFS